MELFFFVALRVLGKLAVEFRLPIIDLSRTFNPHDKTHYGSTPIEPSNVSGQFIADLIAQARQRTERVGESFVLLSWLLLCK